jgi:hypothetical protein
MVIRIYELTLPIVLKGVIFRLHHHFSSVSFFAPSFFHRHYLPSKAMPKNKKFTPNEDIWLARAWVKASQDDYVVGQTSEAVWGRIFDYWKAIHAQEAPGVKINETRTASSLYSRWRKHISTDCKKMDAIKKRHPLAPGEDDDKYMARCLKLYRLEVGHVFRFPGCLEYLKDSPIFNLVFQTGPKKKKREDIPQKLVWNDEVEEDRGGGATGIEGAIETVSVDPQRPLGVKKAKGIKEIQAKSSENKRKEDIKFSKTGNEIGRTLQSLQKTLDRHSLRIHYWKMVDRLEKQGGQDTKVSEYLKKLGELDDVVDTDTPPAGGVPEKGDEDRAPDAGTGSSSSSAS